MIHTGSSSRIEVLKKDYLASLRKKALRRGVWYKALKRIDRVLFDLTLKVANNIRSAKLATQLFSIIQRLNEFMESKVSRAQSEIGYPLACHLSQLAQKWGNQRAIMWAKDKSFARYLAIMHLNGFPSFSTATLSNKAVK